MKKTLTLFLVGVMALGTAFTLSSCSGGTKDGTSDDVITLNDFMKGKKEFHMLSLGHTAVMPKSNLPEAHGAADDTVYVRGTCLFFGVEYECTFVYRTDERYSSDGTFHEPGLATLWITFDQLGATEDASVLKAVGLDEEAMSGSTLELQFNFITHEVEVLNSIRGVVTINYPDPMGEYITFNAWIRGVLNANFYVTKSGASSFE